MKHRTWRDECRDIIAAVIDAHRGEPEPARKAALFAAYPFGARENWPYHVWLDEIARQEGRKQAKRAQARQTRHEQDGQAALPGLEEATP